MKMLMHALDGHQQFRCTNCRARTCCWYGGKSCTTESPFGHLWTPMGTGKRIFAHKEDS